MNKMEQLKKFVKDNEGLLSVAFLGGCIAGYIGITVWEYKTYKTVTAKEWNKVTGKGVFDELLEKPISKAFATVEYDDGEIGVIENVIKVSTKLLEQESDTYRHTNILIDNVPDDKIEIVNSVYGILHEAGLDVTLI